MPGFLLHLGATVQCAHAAPAMPTVTSPRVLLGGQPAATASAPWAVTGCPFVLPGGNGPCVTAQFVTFATRVLAGGTPVLLMDSQAVCAPTGTPVMVTVTQIRVRGQ